MGLFDKVKDAVVKGVDIAEKVLAEQQKAAAERRTAEEEAQKRAAELEAEKKLAEEQEKIERINAIRQQEIENALASDCDKGDCVWATRSVWNSDIEKFVNRKFFFFNCPRDCECVRKTSTQRDQASLFLPSFWPYFKRWLYTDFDMEIRKTDEFTPKHAIIDAYKQEIAEDMIRDLFPCFVTDDEEFKADTLRLFAKILNEYDGFYSDSNVMWVIHSMHGKLENVHPSKFLGLFFNFINTDSLSHPIFKNLSLYKLESYKEKKFICKAIEAIYNFNDAEEAFNLVNQLLNENGELLPIGLGGPPCGHYGKTAWSVLDDMNRREKLGYDFISWALKNCL